ncbi:S41 family peptidase [bacterium]|nr:S41 family peptidase [bacterium]
MAYNNTTKKIIQPIIFALLLVLGIFIGHTLLPKSSSGGSNSLMIYPQANKIEALMNLIEAEYVDTIDKHQMIEDLIPEVLKNLDPHTVYIPAKDLKNVNEELQGSFGGVGVQFNIHKDTVMVVMVISGGPSEKAGLLPGDRIIAVNDSSIAGIGIDNAKVMRLLRGELGTKVTVGIKRRDRSEPISFEITRGTIPVYSVDVSYMINDTIGYIKVSRFAQNTYQEFLTALAKLKAHNCQKVIIDMRGNSGGYLNVANDLCNEFLANHEMIVYTEGKSNPRQELYANGNGTCQNTQVAVLIDEFSASASEIFAGAMQDNDRGIIVGRRSFGKGLVQNQIPLPDGSAIRLTIARYFTPSGRCIQKPYMNGNQDYSMDIMKRFENGEFFEQDSIHFADSLSYTTKKGRTVYGGGGIMPDYFVPRDTSELSNLYYQIRDKGMTYQYALQFTDNHRKEVENFATVKEINTFIEQKDIMSDFVSFLKEKNIKIDRKQWDISKHRINVEIRAFISRNILDNEGFYPVLHELDEILHEAIKQLEE